MNRMKMFLALLVFTLLLLTPSVLQAQQWLETLAVVREQIVFAELSNDEKRRMAEQAQIFLRDLYVHRFEKLAFYPELDDPVPAIEEVVNDIDNLSTAEMEKAIYRIFVAQRDLHLNYIFPSPHADFESFLPLTFTRTASRRDFFEVRVSSVNRELFERFAPDQRIPEVGDRVVFYDDLPIQRAVERQIETAQGANRFGGFTRALGQMTFVPHLLHLVPQRDAVNITLRSVGKGHLRSNYSIRLPWVVLFSEPTDTFQRGVPARREFKPQDLHQGVDLWQQLFNDFTSQHNLEPQSVYPNNPSNEPTLTWGIVENASGRFGYLRLSSFVPDNDDDFAIAEIRRLVFTEFQDTDGLIFDVRDNGGGSIVLADKLSQLFMPNEADVIKARLLNTDLNRRIFNETLVGKISNPEWTQVINDADGTGMVHSDLAFYTSDAQANALGQVYYKPVAVLANARSYSATDLFTCSMKDNAGALVYGEDPLTGAGGANVITHEVFNYVLPEVFEPLPLNHAMRVSWRQSVRFGPSDGKVIEDFGCSANFDVSQTKNDVVTGGETQLAKITRSLAYLARNPRYRAQARPLQNSTSLIVTRDENTYSLYVRNTPYVDLLVNGELISQTPVNTGNREALVTLNLPDDLPIGEGHQITVEGRDRRNRRLWNVKRQIAVIEEATVVEPEGLDIDFSTATGVEPLTILNRNAPENGWRLVSPNLEIGFNPTYADNVDSDALLLLDLSELASAQLAFEMAFDTESDIDFIEVFVTDENENRVSFLRESGARTFTSHEFDLSPFAGQGLVLLHFRFTSNGYGVAPGVRLGRILVTE